MAGGGLADQVVHLAEHPPGVGQHPLPGPRRGHLPGSPAQQAYAQGAFERGEGARDGGLGDAERDGRVGEAALVDDRDQAAQLSELHIHDSSV